MLLVRIAPMVHAVMQICTERQAARTYCEKDLYLPDRPLFRGERHEVGCLQCVHELKFWENVTEDRFFGLYEEAMSTKTKVVVWEGESKEYDDDEGRWNEFKHRAIYIQGYNDPESSVVFERSNKEDAMGAPVWNTNEEPPKEFLLEAVKAILKLKEQANSVGAKARG